MRVCGTPEDILTEMIRIEPTVDGALRLARGLVQSAKGHIGEHQAACLYVLARAYAFEGASILEIGTLLGYSACVIAEAAPLASIITLNPNREEAAVAGKALARFGNVRVEPHKSWQFIHWHEGEFDMIFVDGDHKHILADMPWWNRLKVGGLMVWHDYTPGGVPHPCPPVYEAVNAWRDRLGRALDVEVVDSGGAGMAGLYRREGEVWGQEVGSMK